MPSFSYSFFLFLFFCFCSFSLFLSFCFCCVVPGVIGCLQALEAIKIVTGKGETFSQKYALFIDAIPFCLPVTPLSADCYYSTAWRVSLESSNWEGGMYNVVFAETIQPSPNSSTMRNFATPLPTTRYLSSRLLYPYPSPSHDNWYPPYRHEIFPFSHQKSISVVRYGICFSFECLLTRSTHRNWKKWLTNMSITCFWMCALT